MLRAALLLALAAYSAAAQKPPAGCSFIDCNQDALIRAVPALAGLQFDSNQNSLDALLRATGENLASMFAKFVDISAAEDIHEMRFEEGMAGTSRREVFRYAVNLLLNGGGEQFAEFRLDPNTKAPVAAPAHVDFLVSGRFLRLLNYLLPQHQAESRFRYLGRPKAGGQDLAVVAFTRTAKLQGIAWIDAATKRTVRLLLDTLGPIGSIPLDSITTDIALAPVNFSGTVLWLPPTVTVDARYAGGELHTVHRYSDYRAERDKSAGIPAVAAASGEDAYELVTRAIALIQDGKAGDAIGPLREAARLNPELPAARFYLGNALRTTGDLAGAEAELREAVKLAPDSGVVHNLLGILLSKRGDGPGAVTEFRKSAQLQPKEAVVHFNLAQVLEKSGDRPGALDEYRKASELAPENANFKTRYEQFEHPPETTIKVDVRQVLVPVIVTDKEGHHITGLKQADFQVFENGVEQKISGFSVEDAGLSVPPITGGEGPAPGYAGAPTTAPVSATPKPAPVRRTYVICIDSLHADFGNLTFVRKALSQLFQSEEHGGSQYVVLAIGTSTQLLEETTSDPEKVLQAIEGKDFQKLFLASQKNSSELEMREFRRTLDQVRAACDSGGPECMMKRQLPARADQIASQERFYNVSFLSQLRSLVQHAAQAPGRRTIVLISDGFLLVPGKEAFDLLLAYFPELRMESLRAVDRMQELDPVLRLAANSNVPIYTVDSRGLYTSPFFNASNPGGVARMMPAVLSVMDSIASEAGGTLSEIAAATGGTAFRNSNDILGGLKRAFADGREYYMLAYVSANSNADGKFRAIAVRLRDKKMVVNAKRGYWAATN